MIVHRWIAPAVLGLMVLLVSPASGAVIVDPEHELQLILKGEPVETHISGATYRIAVFSFEDPHGTGLGDALAGLLAQRILTESRVGSIGVIRYEGNLTPSRPGELGYFDKVELIADSQQVSLAVWGIIRRQKDQLRIDTYLQLTEDQLENHFRWTLRLPEGMGGESLTARLRPARIAVQELVLSAADVTNIKSAVSRVNEVRMSPDVDSEVIAQLPRKVVYRVLDRYDDWIKVSTGPLTGWVAASGQCAGQCEQLMRAADFASRLLRYMAFGKIDDPPSGLTADVDAVVDQIRALDALGSTRPEDIWNKSMERARQWTAGGIPPGGAAFHNIVALAQISLMLHDSYLEVSSDSPDDTPGEKFARISLDSDDVAELTFRLAEASLLDPNNPDVLNNLAVLFASFGDQRRASRAAQLAEQALR